MIVNEIKTKVMVFGDSKKSKVQFNSVEIKEVNDYKYLGNIISSIRLPKQDPLKKMCSFLCGQAQRASFSMTSKIKAMGKLPVDVMLNLFDVLIKPILIYAENSPVIGEFPTQWPVTQSFDFFRWSAPE